MWSCCPFDPGIDFAANPGALITPEMLPKQLLDVSLVVHHQNKKFHV
jgi:hypothetical protein